MSTKQKLFSHFQSKTMKLPNRIVMAPMTRNFSPNNVPSNDVVSYYRRRAQGGVGLIITLVRFGSIGQKNTMHYLSRFGLIFLMR